MIVARFQFAADGIRHEEALLAERCPTLLFWMADEPALVVPASRERRADVAQHRARANAEGWPVLARSSGGGVVPQGPQTLNFAMVLPRPGGFTIDDGYRLICDTIAEALTRFDIDVTTGPCAGSFCDGKWNVLHEGRKLAGTAQRWRGRPHEPMALLHAAILLHLHERVPWSLIERLQGLPGGASASPIVRDAHVALDELLPTGAGEHSFPGALVRAGEDRLRRLQPRKCQAA